MAKPHAKIEAGQRLYERFILQMRQLAAKAPLDRLAPAYNYGYFRPTPFTRLLGATPAFKGTPVASPFGAASGRSVPAGEYALMAPAGVFQGRRFIRRRRTLDATFLSAAADPSKKAATARGAAEPTRWDESDPATTFPLNAAEKVNNMPLPGCIVRHLQHPHPLLLPPSSTLSPLTALANAGGASTLALPSKIRGFRVDVRGRRGPRSSVQVIKYGKLGLKRFATDYVDFGKSTFVHKLGTSGVKAWVSYDEYR